jgi:hypothetical protein
LLSFDFAPVPAGNSAKPNENRLSSLYFAVGVSQKAAFRHCERSEAIQNITESMYYIEPHSVKTLILGF